jgi:ATP-dependent DNA helicase RecQ
MKVQLIQSNEDFNLYNLMEIRFFMDQVSLNGKSSQIRDEGKSRQISDEIWEAAKRKLSERYGLSPNIEACNNMLRAFEAVNPKYKYKSDFDIFVRESRLEDFLVEKVETIYVSTIHKAKGREFDNVFLLLDRFGIGTDEAKRQMYVAMTRAKNNLAIHTNGKYLDYIKTENLERINDFGIYDPPAQLVIQLTHKDIWLDFFRSCQYLVSKLNSGDELTIDGDYCRNLKGQLVLKFSKLLINQIEALRQKGYILVKAKVKFILYWLKENADHEIKVILPELYFEITADSSGICAAAEE